MRSSSVSSESPPLDPASPALKAYSCYRSLIEAAGSESEADQGLGGKLLYIGELDEEGRAIAVAGNVAGCATLAATADPEAQKQAIRDGVVDFLVTSLDEALRILKNEIRKHSTVAVCIAAQTSLIEREMHERGVQPDLTRRDGVEDPVKVRTRERSRRKVNHPIQSEAMVTWDVGSQPVKWLPKFDAIALECLQSSDQWNRRWIQRSPRYLGRAASNLRVVCSDREFAATFIEHLRSAFESGEIAAAATVWVASEVGSEIHNLRPANQPSA